MYKYFVLILFCSFIYAKGQPESPKVIAYKINEEITLDGFLNEKLYQNQPVEKFTQRDPNEGAEPTEPTKVWVGYDSKFLYIGAYMKDSQPETIDRTVARRD
ncbi:MAG: hypothetical protein D6830_03160, partial [Ignavibacteria bacterium]